jgi:hypothetical protein
VEQKLEPSNLSDIDNDRKIKILDLAVEVIQYKYNRQEMTKDEYLRLFLAVLKERSKLGRQDADYRMPFPTPPDEGHLSSRVSFGFGIQAGVSFQEIKYRPAYHSLIDQDQGYTEGAQIIFMDTTIRRYADGRIRLEGFELIDIISVSPRDDFFTPVSFKVKTGLIQKLDKYGNDHLAYGLNPGAGLAFKNRIIGLYYVLAEGNLSIGGGFKDNYAAGIGVQAGIIKNITDWWKINLSAETIWYGLGENFREDTVQAVQTFGLNRNNGINMVFLWNSAYTVNRSEIKLSWSRFF